MRTVPLPATKGSRLKAPFPSGTVKAALRVAPRVKRRMPEEVAVTVPAKSCTFPLPVSWETVSLTRTCFAPTGTPQAPAAINGFSALGRREPPEQGRGGGGH